MKRLVAVAVAALLVAVAIVVRSAIDDSDDEVVTGGTGGGDGDTSELVVACVRELADACEALGPDVRIEDPADTIASAAEIDAWVTFDPWPEIAEFVTETGSPFPGAPVTVATTGLTMVVRSAALPASCGEPATWVCVADAAHTVAPAVPRPTTGLGPLALGWAAASWSAITNPDVQLASQDLELDQFRSWLEAIDLSDPDPVGTMLSLRTTGPVAAATTNADASRRVGSAAASGFAVVDTGVEVDVAVIVAGPSASRIASDESLLDGLADLGYVTDEVDPATRTTGLPNAGVLFALQEIA